MAAACVESPALGVDFEIVVDFKKNKSLIARRAYKKGELIFKEKPIVSAQFAWNEYYNYRACEYCLRPLENAQENVRRLAENGQINLPHLRECCETNKSLACKCERCGVEYCSAECRTNAFNNYHQLLCLGPNGRQNTNHPINILMDYWRQIHLPPESTTIYLVLKLMAMMKQKLDKSLLMSKLQNFECGLTNEIEQIPHKLLSEKYFDELENLRELTLEVFNNYLYVKEFEPCLTKEGFRRLFSLIGRNAQGIATSPFSTYVNNLSKVKLSKVERKKLDKYIDKIYSELDKTAGSFLDSEGTGLYELQAIINHSCEPNVQILFDNNCFQLSIVALRDIQPNEEMLSSYLNECQLSSSRHTRRKILRENYLFTCDCVRCEKEINQPDVTSDEDEELEEDDEDEYEDIDDEDEDQNEAQSNGQNNNDEIMEN